jgi:hypothetical protein
VAWHVFANGDPIAILLIASEGRRYEPMHTGPHGTSQKASDYTCLPGCRTHHRELDHRLGKAFWAKYGLNREKLVAALRARYESEKPQ